MDNFLKFADRRGICDKFFEFCKDTGEGQTLRTFLSWLDENEAMNRDNCRKLLGSKPEPVTDPLTVESIKEIMQINKEQNAALEKIIESIDSYINTWGKKGKLIDRETVIKALEDLRSSAKAVIKEEKK